MQVIKAGLCRDRLGRERVGGWGSAKGGGIGRGGDGVEDRAASWWQWVSIQGPPPPLPTTSTPSSPARGVYTIGGKEKCRADPRCRSRTGSPHSPKSPAPILPSWIMLRGALSATQPLCKTMIPSSDVNSLEGETRVTVKWVSWCIWTLIYMSANSRGGSSHVLGTLKTLISYIIKVEMDKYCKMTDTGERRKLKSEMTKKCRGEIPVSK